MRFCPKGQIVTLGSCVRFTTTELADLDAKISGAADKVLALELEIFEAFVARAASFAEPIRMSAHAMAQLDVQTAPNINYRAQYGG